MAALNPCVSSDNGDPELRGVSVTPTTVDVSKRAQRVRVVVAAADTGGPGPATGIVGGSVYLEGEEGDAYTYGPLRKTASGAWAVTFRVPRTRLRGLLYQAVVLWDAAGNRRSWAYNNLHALGYPYRFRVAGGRYRDPSIGDLDLAARTVDTRRRAKTLPVTLRLAGDFTPDEVMISAKEYNEPHRTSAVLHRVPGAPHTFTGALPVRRWQTNGRWRVTRIHMSSWIDDTGWAFGFADLRRAGADRRFRVISGRDDRTGPRLRTFGLSPDNLDVRLEPGSVTATARLSDTGSGVAAARVIVRDGWGLRTSFPMRRITGGPQLGTWQAVATLDTCAQAGNRGTAVVVTDRSGNRRTYYGTDLAAAGFAHNVAVQAKDNIPPRAEIVSVDDTTGNPTVGFNEDVNGVSTDSIILFVGRDQIDDFTWTDPGPPIPGAWTCQTELGETTDCLTGNVRQAIFDRAGTDGWNTVEINPNHQLALTDLAGNPPDRVQPRGPFE